MPLLPLRSCNLSAANVPLIDPGVHVTAVITHRVRPGREAGHEEWIKGIAADARCFEGYLGAHILRPQLGLSSDHVIVVEFATGAQLDTWMQSETRKAWIDRVQPLILEPESIKVLTGLEPWFQLPGQPSRPAPKRYKQALLVWVAVAGISLLVTPHVAALLAFLPAFLRVLLNAGITVLLLTYWVMPFLTRCFRSWLFRA
jgi:antibiotic biosynthesis monooxygenase (ABM) superfamily enzyme